MSKGKKILKFYEVAEVGGKDPVSINSAVTILNSILGSTDNSVRKLIGSNERSRSYGVSTVSLSIKHRDDVSVSVFKLSYFGNNDHVEQCLTSPNVERVIRKDYKRIDDLRH